MEMTIDKAYSKLRKSNIGNYKLVVGCIFFSILLISSFAVIMQSHTIQTILPEGGDSRKQMYLIFGIAVFGCLVFSVYASSLFFKSKSKEMGVMMAMGTPKKVLTNLLLKEVTLISVISTIAGCVLALPLAAGIWQLFKIFIANTDEMAFSVDFAAYIWSGIFALTCILTLFFMAIRFLQKSNIIEILYSQRKTEMVKDVKAWYGVVGIVLMLIGLIGGYMKSELFINVFKMLPPFWSNAIFLLVPLGLYMFSVYIVVRSKKGKNKYKNIIGKSMMKFQGRQTVRNMCVVALLLVGGLFAVFYLPTLISGFNANANNMDYSYEFRYIEDENIPQKPEIEKLAEKNDLTLKRYKENDSVILASDGIQKDYDENDKATEEYMERISEIKVIKESDYNKISGENVDIKNSKFGYIREKGDLGTVYDYIDDITMFTNPTTGKTKDMSFQENINYTHMLDYFIIDDSDYNEISRGLDTQWKEKMVWFDVDDYENSFAFATELKDDIIDRSSSKVEIAANYDRIVKAETNKKGEDYFGDTDPMMQVSYEDKGSAQFNTDWKYMPNFKIVKKSELMINYSVYLLLFAFIALICLAAVIVILYTRSITIAINNRQVFEDLKHLGASNTYLEKSIKSMISQIYVVPSVIGIVIIFSFYMMIMLFNSGNISLSDSEVTAVMIDVVIVVVVSGILFTAYKATMKSVHKILNM